MKAKPRAPGPNPLDSLPKTITAAPAGSGAPYVLRGKDSSAFFTEKGVMLCAAGRPAPGAGPSERRGFAVEWGMIGAKDVTPRPEGETTEMVHQYIGDKSRWTSDQKSYSAIGYDQIQEGIDLKVESQSRGLKYTVRVAPGADVGLLRFQYRGVRNIQVDPDGASVEIGTEIGTIREDSLVVYQDGPEGRRAIEARYEALGNADYAIALGEYDPQLPLIVDPMVSWSTFLGGSVSPQGEDDGYSIAVDNAGNVYVTGYTFCVDFFTLGVAPQTPISTTLKGSVDGFLVKLNPSGTVAWSTYIGGSGIDYCYAVAVEPGGAAAYVTGYTASDDFPTTGGVIKTVLTSYDAFVMKFASNGTLTWSTFLGGNSLDYGQAIAVDASSNVYVGGYTYSSNFPIVGGFQAAPSTTPDAFVAKLNSTGTALIWSTYLGGNNTDYIYGLAVDSVGSVYVTGVTYSSDFPAVAPLGTTTLKGTTDAFLTKIKSDGTQRLWSTYIGGTNYDYGYGVCVTNDVVPGDPVVVGYTSSPDFPTTFGAARTSFVGNETFVTRYKSDGSAVVYATFVGGNSYEYGQAIATGPAGSVYVAGYTYSGDFPVSGYKPVPTVFSLGFVTQVHADGKSLDASALVGGNSSDFVRGIAVVPAGNPGAGVYVTGTTYSTNLGTAGLDTTLGGQLDAFVCKLPLTLASLTWSTYVGGNNSQGTEYGYAIAIDPSTANTVFVSGQTTSADFPVTTGAINTSLRGLQDVYLTKISTPAGPGGVPNIVWSTYLGGNGYDYASGLTVDHLGFPYVVGYTGSTDYPNTTTAPTIAPNPVAPFHGGYDAFVTCMNPGGTIYYSTFIGGSSTEYGKAIAVDTNFNAYVTGYTYSTDLATPGGFQTTPGTSTPDGFVAMLNVTGTLIWASYLGGNNGDYPSAIACDSAGNACYITGYTYSTDFPTKPLGSTSLHGTTDAFVTAVAGAGSVGPIPGTLLWSRYLGGASYEFSGGIAVDAGNTAVYATGYTYSNDYPSANLSPIKNTLTGGIDAYVTRLVPGTGAIVWSTFLGGFSTDIATAAAVDSASNVYVAGYTFSSDFPNKGAFQPTIGGLYDAFVTKIYADGSAIAWSSFMGGTNYDYAYGVSVDANNVVYVTGYTLSSDFPLANPLTGAFSGTPAVLHGDQLQGGQDAFIVRLDNANPNPPDFSGVGTGQFRLDGTTQLAVGAWSPEQQMIVKGKVSDSDDDQVKLQVEMKHEIADFDASTFLYTSPLVNSGQIASVTVNLHPLGDPTAHRYHWRARTIDSLGHLSAWVSFGGNSDLPLPAARDVGKDQTAPTVSITTPTALATYYTTAASIGLAGPCGDDAAGVTTVAWTNSANGSFGGAVVTAGTSWTIASIPLKATAGGGPVPNLITVTATDAAGNSSQAQITVYRDNTAPLVGISGSDFVTASGSPTISGTASDNLQLQSVTWTNNRGGSGTASPTGPTTWSATITGLSPGVNVITVTATDASGNFSTSTQTITYDTTPPSLAITAPTNTFPLSGFVTASATVNVSGTASDNVLLDPSTPILWKNLTNGSTLGSVSLTPPAPPFTSISWLITGIPIQAGSNTIQIQAKDSVGNLTTTSITVFGDTALPSVAVTSPAPGFITGATTVSLSGTSSDDIGVKSIGWTLGINSGSGTLTNFGSTSSTWTISSIPLNTGAVNHIQVTVTDLANQTKSIFFDVTQNNSAPTVFLTSPGSNPFFTNAGTVLVEGTAASSLAQVASITVTNLTTSRSFTVTTTPATLPATPVTDWQTMVDLVLGDNTIQITVQDTTPGTPLQTVVTTGVIYDPIPPLVTITGPTTAATYGTGVNSLIVSGTASDNRGLNMVTWSTDAAVATTSGTCQGTAAWTVDPLNPIPLKLGLQHITITAQDLALNTSSTVLAVYYDPTNPMVAITFPSVSATFVTLSSTTDLKGTASDNTVLQNVSWVNAANGTGGAASGGNSWTVTAIGLVPGANPITAIATDIAGNITTATITVYYDTQSPLISVTSPIPSGTYITSAANVSVAGTASDDIGLNNITWVNAATGANGTANGTTNWSDLAISLVAGDNLITITATDLVGQATSASITVHYDPTPPVIAITSPTSTGSTSTTVTPIALSGTTSDLPGGSIVPVNVTLVTWYNLTTGGSGTATLNPGVWSAAVPLTVGTNLIQVFAYDAAGNSSFDSITVVYDAAAPFVTITTPTTGLSYATGTAPAVLAGTAIDDIGVQTVTWSTDAAVLPSSGPATGTGNWQATVPLAPGINTISITATDGVGRTGTSRLTITYDPTPPSVAITSPTADPLYLTTLSPLSLGGAASDNLQLQSVTWVNATTGDHGVASGVGAWTVTGINLIQGNNVITVTATDGVGNTSSATITVNYDSLVPTLAIDPIPPALLTAIPPPYVTSTRPMTITGTAGDNLHLTSVTWTDSLGGGGTAALVNTGPPIDPQHPLISATWSAQVYLLPGDNIITVTATDEHGLTTTQAITVTFVPESVAPTVAITGPTSTGSAASASQVVALSGTADDNVAVVAVTWLNRATGVRGTAILTPVPLSTAVTWTANVPLVNGTNLITVTAADDAGNLTSSNITVTYSSSSDAVNPAVTITVPGTGVVSAGASPLIVQATATDNIGVASVTWTNAATGGGGVATPLAGNVWSASIGLASGANAIVFTAHDPSGNTASDTLIVNFVPAPGDSTSPQVHITSYPTAVSLNVASPDFTLSGTASDNVEVAEVVWFDATTSESGDALGTTSWTGSLTLMSGVNVITIRAWDTSGNSSTDQMTVIYTPPPPPPVHIAAGACGLTGLEVVLTLLIGAAWARRARKEKRR